MTRLSILAICIIVAFGTQARSDEPLPAPVAPPETVAPVTGSLQATDAAHARAGYPQRVAPWARLTYGPDYAGYLVGGGKVPTRIPRKIQAQPPYSDEGTWGMDYAPWWTKVDLLWTHGQLYQGGTGQYEPDHKNFPFDQRFGRRVPEAP
jgi:hypothetical protein